MRKEFEIINHPQIMDLNIFLVRLTSRVPHSHNELEIGVILDGSLTITVNGRTNEFHTGDIYILNPMEIHGIQSVTNSCLILAIQMSKKLIASYFSQSENSFFIGLDIRSYFPQHRQDYQVLHGLCIELAYNYFCQLANYEFKCMGLLNMILYILSTHIPQKVYSSAELSTYQKKHDRMSKILDYIDNHFQHKLLLSDIAKKENLSLDYLSHFFKDQMNISFQDYVNEKRFERACTMLLNTDKKIITISLECGFSDIRYLNQLCRKHYSCSPKELRKQNGLRVSGHTQNSMDLQNLFVPKDSILLLSTLRNQVHAVLEGYSIWEFFR